MLTYDYELIAPGQHGRPGDLPASNGVMLRAMFAGLPVEVEDLGIVPDDLTAQTEAFRRASTADIIVTTGGASVGDHDLVKPAFRSEEHTSELQSLMRISYAVFCLKKK